MDTIFNQEELIFSEYKADKKLLVKDGLCFGNLISEYSEDSYMNIEAYISNLPRIVFVCKEANKNEGEDYRYWDWITRKFYYLFGDSIAFWLEGILSVTSKGYPLKADINKRREIFKKYPLVLMNIKKIAGESKSNWNTIYNSAKENATLLQKQISLYAPNIIFCCGSSDNKGSRNRMINIVKKYLYPNDDFDLPVKDWHYCYYNRKKHLLLIDIYHPSYPKEDCWKFDRLFKEYHEFLKLEGELWFTSIDVPLKRE